MPERFIIAEARISQEPARANTQDWVYNLALRRNESPFKFLLLLLLLLCVCIAHVGHRTTS